MTSAGLATNCKPTIGFHSKTSAIVALRESGMSWSQIDKSLGLSPGAAASLVTKAKKRQEKAVRLFEMPANLWLDLERAAVRRNMQVNDFARKILIRVVVDKLYAAILDD
jgi:hypothetical protein